MISFTCTCSYSFCRRHDFLSLKCKKNVKWKNCISSKCLPLEVQLRPLGCRSLDDVGEVGMTSNSPWCSGNWRRRYPRLSAFRDPWHRTSRGVHLPLHQNLQKAKLDYWSDFLSLMERAVLEILTIAKVQIFVSLEPPNCFYLCKPQKKYCSR